MEKVYTHKNSAMVHVARNALESLGIACEIKNENLSGALGEFPVFESWPELWIVNSKDLQKAQKCIASLASDPPANTPSWTCPACGEVIEGQFFDCWSCGTPKPAP